MTITQRLVHAALATTCAIVVAGRPAVAEPASASPVPAASAAGLARTCPDIGSITSSDGSDYAVIFQSADAVTATIALRLYAGDHDYLVTLPSVAVTGERTLRGMSQHQSAPIHLRKPPGLLVYAASVYATLLSPANVVCDVKNIDVDAPHPSPLAGKVAPGSGAVASAVDLVPTDPTRFTCTNPFAAARVTHPVEPIYPRFVDADGEVTIEVMLADDGSVTGTSVLQSSGNAVLDNAGLSAAKNSTYSPGLDDCKPHAGAYLFHVQFQRTR